MSDAAAEARALVPIANALRKAVREWTDDELRLVIAFAIHEIRRLADPRESDIIRTMLADQGVHGARAEAGIQQRQEAAVGLIVKTVRDVATEIERRHPNRVVSEGTWRAHLVQGVEAVIGQLRG